MFDRLIFSRYRRRWAFVAVFGALALLYGALAMQGALPFMSPDETAVFASAQSFGSGHGLGVLEPRAITFSWLHPRSFVAQNGALLPVAFPFWMAFLGLFQGIGFGSVLLWVAVIVSASACLPLMRLYEDELGYTRIQSMMGTLAVMTLPTMILYGNRSLFTLVPQLSALVWTIWLTSRLKSASTSLLAGLASALVIGWRPVEAVWLFPILIGAMIFWSVRSGSSRALTIVWWVVGFMGGIGIVGAVHALVYGAPWQIGYLLRDMPAPVIAAHAGTAVVVEWWRPFFPFGFSLSQLRQNIQGSVFLGWWPWMLFWMAATGVWLLRLRNRFEKREAGVFVLLILTTLWLVFYYGQGRYADNIGGQAFHLGSSLYRYLTPIMVFWTVWSFWVVRRFMPERFATKAFFLLAMMHIVGGVAWAYLDPVDGILQNREDRQSYQAVRSMVLEKSSPQTIWLSDRSDKIVFPWRAAVSPLPNPEEVRRFLETQKQPVWIFRRPPGQQERDAWSATGLELVEKERFPREMVYEVRLKISQ